MKKYSKNAVCKKCGGVRIDTQFVPSKPILHHGTPELYHLDGYIERTCRTCGHGWGELPLDAEEGNET